MSAKLKWSTLLTIARILPRIKPVLAELVLFAEALIPDSGNGREKLERVKQMLEALWGTLDVARVAFRDAWPAIEAAIAAIVAVFNRKGWPELPKVTPEEPPKLDGGVDE